VLWMILVNIGSSAAADSTCPVAAVAYCTDDQTPPVVLHGNRQYALVSPGWQGWPRIEHAEIACFLNTANRLVL